MVSVLPFGKFCAYSMMPLRVTLFSSNRLTDFSRLDEEGSQKLKRLIQDKNLVVASLDLPTSHMALAAGAADEYTQAMLKAINGMMLDMLAAIAKKDYQDRRRRQEEGITKAKAVGEFR